MASPPNGDYILAGLILGGIGAWLVTPQQIPPQGAVHETVREVVRETVREVPGPVREIVREVPGPTREIIREVPAPQYQSPLQRFGSVTSTYMMPYYNMATSTMQSWGTSTYGLMIFNGSDGRRR